MGLLENIIEKYYPEKSGQVIRFSFKHEDASFASSFSALFIEEVDTQPKWHDVVATIHNVSKSLGAVWNAELERKDRFLNQVSSDFELIKLNQRASVMTTHAQKVLGNNMPVLFVSNPSESRTVYINNAGQLYLCGGLIVNIVSEARQANLRKCTVQDMAAKNNNSLSTAYCKYNTQLIDNPVNIEGIEGGYLHIGTIDFSTGKVKLKDYFTNAFSHLDTKGSIQRQFTLSFYKKRNNEITFLNLMKWFSFYTVGRNVFTDEQVKSIQNSFKPETYYVYRMVDNFGFISSMIYERTKSTSCMYKNAYYADKSDWYNPWIVSDKNYNRVFTHGFDMYELGNHITQKVSTSLLLVSELSPEQLNGTAFKGVKNFPFIARAFAEGMSICFGRAYGIENCTSVLNKIGSDGISAEQVFTNLYTVNNENGLYVMPYLDCKYSSYGSIEDGSQGTLREILARKHEADMVASIIDNLPEDMAKYLDVELYRASAYNSDYELNFEINSYGEVDVEAPQEYCQIKQYYFDLDDMVYIEDIDGYVCEEFAIYTNNEWVLDGLALYNFYR